MKLRDLDAEFVLAAPNDSIGHTLGLKEAQGVMFLCPKCFAENHGDVGTHSVVCWFRDRGVPSDRAPGPGRWDVSGTSIDDLTLNPSVHLSGAGCGWHGWIRNGDAT